MVVLRRLGADLNNIEMHVEYVVINVRGMKKNLIAGPITEQNTNFVYTENIPLNYEYFEKKINRRNCKIKLKY